MVGYGIFWAIVEDLYNNANALRMDYDGIAFDLRVEIDVVESVINDFDLFSFDQDCFGSISVERRLNERNEKSKKARESASYRWNKKDDNANAMRTHNERNAIKERKGKERKEKKETLTVLSFDEFWNAYDKKTGKDVCMKKYKSIDEKDRQLIKDTLPNYLSTIKDKQFQKNPLTYLNQKIWLDECEKELDVFELLQNARK